VTITPDNLRAVPLLKGLDERQRRKLAGNLHERTFPKGKEVVKEGEGGVGFFMILDGSATVTCRGETRATLGPGDSFGELALIDRFGDRSATVTAATELRCAGITAWEFRPFVKENPDVAWHLLETLAQRVRDAEKRAADRSALV
jgi:CRP/FNR family cyclic AMP-dependent transcriptional regulator